MRPVTTLPLGRSGSLLNTARAYRAVASIAGRQAGDQISSSLVMRPINGVRRAAELRIGHHQPGLHVADARSIGPAIGDVEPGGAPSRVENTMRDGPLHALKKLK